MQLKKEITLIRDTPATIIPAGDECIIPAGTIVNISQALGGAVTVRTPDGLFRIPGKEWDALGKEIELYLEEKLKKESTKLEPESFSENVVWNALKECFDPEIPLNIVDLGLVYDLKISEPDASKKVQVNVKMTLTAQGCGMGPIIADDAKNKIQGIPEVKKAQVDIIWDPPWNPHMISEFGKKELGLT